LIAELRRLREASGLSREEAGDHIGAAEITIFRYEKGLTRPQPAHVTALLDAYGVTGPERDTLVQLAKDARKRGWWYRHRETFKPGFDAYIGLEAEAATLRTYEAQVIPGLLQTPAYARAIIQAMSLGERPGDIDEKISVRMERQNLLTGIDPMQLTVVLDESVLHRPVGSTETMRAQLLHIADVSKLPNVTLQVLPFTAGAHAAMDGSFTLVEFTEPTGDALVYVEMATSGLAFEDEPEVRRYTLIFGHLTAIAIDPDQSREMIVSLVKNQRWPSGREAG
jgi:transcriptional regulator with XRE-family HTH domain